MDLVENEWFIEAPWGKICIVAWGDAINPPVLLATGTEDSAVSYRPLVKLMPKDFYYICMEWPGHGKSSWLPGTMMINLLDMAYSIEVVRRHFRWETFPYVSHSTGCLLGKFYNLAYPGRMSKVVELDPITPVFGIDPDGFAEWYNRYFTNYYKEFHKYKGVITAPTYTMEQAIEKVAYRRGLTPEIVRPIIERFSEPVGDGRIRFTFDQRIKLMTRPPFTKEQVRKLFTSIKTPTLAIIASESIHVGLYKTTPFVLKNFTNNYKALHFEGNHELHVISPETVVGFISKFLLYGLEGIDGKSKL